MLFAIRLPTVLALLPVEPAPGSSADMPRKAMPNAATAAGVMSPYLGMHGAGDPALFPTTNREPALAPPSDLLIE